MSRRRAALAVFPGLVLLVAGLAPSPTAPVAWTPTPDPGFRGDFAEERTLEALELLPLQDGIGPEDVELDAEGRIYAGDRGGRILRWGADGSGPEIFAETGGRALGLHPGPDGALLAADAERGLIAIDPGGGVQVLLDNVQGRSLRFADDLETTRSGTVYFSEASDRFGLEDWKLDVLESRPNGRLIRFEPASGAAEVVLDGLHFANGVAVSHEQDFVLVVETSRYRLRRLWIEGPRAGEDEIWIDALPGFPDGVSAGSEGRYWVAIASPRNPLLDATAGLPWLRSRMALLPAPLQPAPSRYPHVLALDREGRVLCSLQDPSGARFAAVTSAQERGGWLYLGSLSEPAIGRIPIPARCGG